MKRLLLNLIIVSILFLTSAFSQQSNSVLIVIESPDFETISTISQLKTYVHDDDFLCGEIQSRDLPVLEKRGISYQIIDEQGWSADYYLLTPRPFGPAIDKVKAGDVIYMKENRSIVKIDRAREYELFTAGYQLEKITPIGKPLPKISQIEIPFPVVPDSIVRSIIDKVSASSLESGVKRLQDFKTRYTYSDSIIRAAQWIHDQYIQLGYMDVQYDTFYVNSVPHRNVIATKPGLIYPDSVIMIGGHYDSIVFGTGTNSFVYAPGANDNASGTVAAIEAARVFADHEFEATIKFVAWDAEEIGLVGSYYYAQKAYLNKEPISLYINLDMIANYNISDPLRNVTIYANAPTMPYAELMANMAKKYTPLIPFIPGNSGGSDHASFQNWGYRALFGQEGDFSPHWHKITDVTGNMDFNYMKEVVQMSLATIISLAGPADNFSGMPFVKYKTHTIDDDMTGASYGNGNGYIDAGETIELFLTIKNFGDVEAKAVSVNLTSPDPFINIMTANQSYGSIAPNATMTNPYGFVFQVSKDISSGQKLNFDINIKDSKGNTWISPLTLNIIMPHLVYRQKEIHEVAGNGDGKIDAGEKFNLVIELENIGLRYARNISAILKADQPAITISDSLAKFEDIPQYNFGKNAQDFFTIEISPAAKTEIVSFALHIDEDGGFYQTTISFNLAIGQTKILIVEDDGKADLSDYYKESLELLGIPYDHWDTGEKGPMTKDSLRLYHRVIWYTGTEFGNSLFRHGTKVIENYLENGGKAFLSGSLFAFSVRDSALMSDYLRTKYVSFNTNLHHLQTRGTDPVLGNTNFWLSKKGETNQSLTGEIDAMAPAQPILYYDTATSEGPGRIQSSGAAAIAIANKNYRAVLFSFGWEGIDDSQIRQQVMVKTLNWLQGISSSVGDQISGGDVPHTFELLQNYPNPFNPSTTIQFDLPATNRVSIKIFNVTGQEIKTLIDANLPAGRHSVIWNGKDSQERQVTSGLYFYHLSAGDFQKTRKMILLF